MIEDPGRQSSCTFKKQGSRLKGFLIRHFRELAKVPKVPELIFYSSLRQKVPFLTNTSHISMSIVFLFIDYIQEIIR